MNVYDFDGTIYDGDSTVDFYKFCLMRYPKVVLALPCALHGLLLFLFGLINKTAFKERFFSFLRYVPNIENEVAEFCRKSERKIMPWYLAQKQDADVVISAAPEFLIVPFCAKLDVALIGSRVDKQTGIFDGENCYGEEKVRRLASVVNIVNCSAFYSDSISDKPLADLIPNSFIVRGGRIIPWLEYKPSVLSKMKQTFITPEFIVFVFCGGCGSVVNFLVSLIFAQKINPTIAYIIGYTSGLFVSYILNSALIFKVKPEKKRFVMYTISYIPNFLISFTFVAILLNVFHIWEVIVYASATILGLPISFILVKRLAFSRKGKGLVE